MPRYVLPILILGVIALAAILSWWTLGRGGSAGDTAMADRDVGPFHRIEINGAADVTLRQGSGEHLGIETPSRGLRVAASVEDGTLTITARDTRRWWQNLFGGTRGGRIAKVTITFRNLDAVSIAGAVRLTSASLETPELRVEASGGSTLRIDGLKTNLLRVEADGALKARLAGTATEQHIEISGASEYNAGELASRDATVDVSGVGRVVLRVEKTLDASISGAGSVEYYGNPQVKKSISGVGKVRQRDAEAVPLPGGRIVAAASEATATR
jgi:hypothetical protein